MTGIDCIITQCFNNSTTYILFIWSDKCCEQARFFRIGFTWCALIYNLSSQQKIKEDDTEVRNSVSFHLLAHHPSHLLKEELFQSGSEVMTIIP